LNFGGMGGYSVTKLVKPIKTVCSWTPHQAGVSHFLLAKTQPHIRTVAARILGEANALCGKKSADPMRRSVPSTKWPNSDVARR